MKNLRILILTPSNEVKRLLLEVELGLCIVDRGGSGGRANKVKSGLGLPLATAMPGNKGCFPALRGTDEVLLPVVLTVEFASQVREGLTKLVCQSAACLLRRPAP